MINSCRLLNNSGSRQDVPPIVVSITKIYPFQVGQFSDTASIFRHGFCRFKYVSEIHDNQNVDFTSTDFEMFHNGGFSKLPNLVVGRLNSYQSLDMVTIKYPILCYYQIKMRLQMGYCPAKVFPTSD